MNHHKSTAAADTGSRERHFDQTARALHAEALDSVSPQVRARLQQARHAASRNGAAKHSPMWTWAGSTAVLALALGVAVQFQNAPVGTSSAPLATAPNADPTLGIFDDVDPQISDLLATLDESPDFYLWLAANDGALSHPTEQHR